MSGQETNGVTEILHTETKMHNNRVVVWASLRATGWSSKGTVQASYI